MTRRRRLLAAVAVVLAVLAGLAGLAGTLAASSGTVSVKRLGYGSAPAPRCVPSQLNESAVLPGTSLAVSPLPGSYDAPARTQIALLGAPSSSLGDLHVRGSRSGAHGGDLRAYSQGDGASFVPSEAFTPGETVTVTGTVAGTPFSFGFLIARPDDRLYVAPVPHHRNNLREHQHFRSRPDLEPPVVVVTTRSPHAAAGDVLAAPYNGPGASGPMIFDGEGNLVWFHPLPRGTEAADLQVQQYGGAPVVTWWQGTVTAQGFGEGEEIIDDTSYRQVARVHAANGYKADLHDFHLRPDGTALLTVLQPVFCDLSRDGGPASAAVTDGVFQELDLRTGLVRREWHSIDHVALRDSSTSARGASAGWPFDYFHLNSVEQRGDGTTLLSARNTSALYELNTLTGQVLARVGGRHSDIRLAPGASTAYQHDATTLHDGTISIFDNGAVPKVHSQSRALVVSVDRTRGTETLLAQYRHPQPPLVSVSQGSAQPLANGDVFVGWGSQPYFTEFGPGGELLFDAHLHGSYQSYRAYRSAWPGAPAEAPSITAVSSRAHRSVSAYASWNGDTRTVSWRLMGGQSPSALAPLATAPRAGFETLLSAPGAAGYLAVQALDSSGRVLASSRVARPPAGRVGG